MKWKIKKCQIHIVKRRHLIESVPKRDILGSLLRDYTVLLVLQCNQPKTLNGKNTQ